MPSSENLSDNFRMLWGEILESSTSPVSVRVPVVWWEAVGARCRRSRSGRGCVRVCPGPCTARPSLGAAPGRAATAPPAPRTGAGQKAASSALGAGLLGALPAARQHRRQTRLVEQPDGDLPSLSGLLEIFVFQCNTLAVGFGRLLAVITVCHNMSLLQ